MISCLLKQKIDLNERIVYYNRIIYSSYNIFKAKLLKMAPFSLRYNSIILHTTHESIFTFSATKRMITTEVNQYSSNF